VEQALSKGVRYLAMDPKPQVLDDRMVWDLGDLQANSERRLAIQAEPIGDAEIASWAKATFSTVSGLRTRMSEPRLSVTASTAGEARLGDLVKVVIKVKNTGTGPADNLKIRVQLPEGLEHPAGKNIEADAGALQPGQIQTFTLKTEATHTGKWTCELTAMADDCSPSLTQTQVRVSEAALNLHAQLPEKALVNQEMEYQLQLANIGSISANNVKLSLAIPRELETISISGGKRSEAQPGVLEFAFAKLDPETKKTILVRAKAKSAGEFRLVAVAQAEKSRPIRSEFPIKVDGVAGVTLQSLSKDSTLELGAETTYEIRVINQGTAACTNVGLTALLPEGLSAQSAVAPVRYTVQRQAVKFDTIDVLPVQGEVKFQIALRGQKPGDWRIKAQLTCDPLQQPLVKEEAIKVYNDQ
jgi:uncharacterized repeat protein (TIGR01451 family)